MSSPHPHARAIFHALLGYACWVAGDTFLKLSGSTAVPKYEIMIIGGFSGIVSIFLVTAMRGELAQLRPHRYGGLAALGVIFFLSYGFFLFTLAHMQLANFYAIIFIAPILITGIASLMLGEAVKVTEWLAIGTAFLGVLIAVNPTHLVDTTTDWRTVGAAFAGMCCVTVQMIVVRVLSRTETRECMALYPRLGPCFGGLIVMALLGFEPIPPNVLFYACATGAIGGLGWVLIAHAYKEAPAGTIAPFQYCEILLGSLAGYLIWGDVPTRHVMLGATIIVASGIYVVRHLHPAPARRYDVSEIVP